MAIMKKVIYVEMDGVLCDYKSRCKKLNVKFSEAKRTPGFYKQLKPVKGAIETYRKLCEKCDVYVLMVASRDNAAIRAEKMEWLNKYLPKARILVMRKDDPLMDKVDFLINDYGKRFEHRAYGHKVKFGSSGVADWDSVYTFIEVYSDYFEEDSVVVTSVMAEKTIKMLDEYAAVLNEECAKGVTPELSKKVLNVASFTNQWLAAMKEENESVRYDV